MFSMLAAARNRRLRRVPADTHPTPTISAIVPSASASAHGVTFTLTGTGFTYGGVSVVKSVLFGLESATSFTVDSATQITATCSATGLSSTSAVVNTLGGCATVPLSVGAAPTISSLSLASGTHNGGTAVSVYGADFTAGSVTFNGTAGTGYSLVSSGWIDIVSPAGTAGAGLLRVTNADYQYAETVWTYT